MDRNSGKAMAQLLQHHACKGYLPGANGGFPAGLTNINGTLFFGVWDGTNGTELWKSDGTAAGTTLVKDIYPGANASNAAGG